MESGSTTAIVSDRLLSLVNHAVAEQVPPGQPSFVRRVGLVDVDSALHLATSAKWTQRVTVTLEMYAVGEPHPEPGPEWELDATGIFPQLVKDHLGLATEQMEYAWLPFTPEVGDYHFEAWVTGRNENRDAVNGWEDWQFKQGGASLAWEEAQNALPTCVESWIVRLTPVTPA
jgi:hypothetical protein